MGWVDKALERSRMEKKIKAAMNTPEFKKARQKELEQATLRAYCRFVLIACDYLNVKHNYKKNGLISFLGFASKRLLYTAEQDEKYFTEINKVFIDECGLDVMEYLGLEVKKGGGTLEKEN